ncbi:glycosyltransferase family 2 protein [Spirosoma jeollabukense]
MKFTIAIPAFKATYLKECIDSILAQTTSDFELIIVNDASPENLDEIIDSYDSHQISYYKNEVNFGALNVVDNWNKCLSYAKGSFFILMGDDDKMCPDYLEVFSDLIDKYPVCDVYHCRTIVIDENSKPLWITGPRPEFEQVHDSILERMKGNRLFFISDYVYRTETLKKDGGFFKLPLAWASDDITSYIAAEHNGIAHTNKPVFMYRQNSYTISTTGNVMLKMDAILEEEKWLDLFVKKEPQDHVSKLVNHNIRHEIKKFIQKKKIRTIYSSINHKNIFSYLKWFGVKNKYRLSTEELIYALLLSLKERRKIKYEQI